MKTHYDTLGLPSTAEKQDIKKAYFDLAKKYHPDSGDEAEVKKFYEITEAYKVLTDKDLKKAYDATLTEGLERIKAAQAETGPKAPPEPTIQTQKRDPYRDIELREFHRNRFKKAVFRVVMFCMVCAVLGILAALILKGFWFLGFLAGAMIGFNISIRENFDISTFFESKKKQKIFHVLIWLMPILGILYFVIIALI